MTDQGRAEYPAPAACDWIGHDALISKKHYTGATEADVTERPK
jgi:hypothetical protein